MNSRIKVDRISSLPNNIIDSILTRLEIKEAVRTSVLSQSWRYHWHSLSEIKIKWHDLSGVSQSAFVKIIDNIILVHCGSVHKFELETNLEICNDVHRWILYLSRNGIKVLTIKNSAGNCHNLPSCLFSCSDLTNLQFFRCALKPPPAAFKAFSNLTQLVFFRVEITDKVLANLLNSCPLLRMLFLNDVTPHPSIEINAPNLVSFFIEGFHRYPRFKNTPLLNRAAFGSTYLVSSQIANNNHCKIVDLLGSMPRLKKLVFHGHAFQYLAVGDIPARLPVVCPIKLLILPIDFEDLRELLTAFCIFRSCPLQFLDITVCAQKGISADGFWNGAQDLGFKFDHLQQVKMQCFRGTESELKFVQLLFSNAPSLETMEVNFRNGTKVEDVLAIVAKLTVFTRISPKAILLLKYD